MPTRRYTYIEYYSGEMELYDRNADPFELTNISDTAGAPAGLAFRLHALESCAGGTCRSAEDGH